MTDRGSGVGVGIAMWGIIPEKIYVPAPGEGQVPQALIGMGMSFRDSRARDCISGPDQRKASRS